MIKLIRVDHRLLHGQVALSWFGYLNADCILIANDNVPVNPIRKASIKMAKPTGSKLVIMPIQKSIDAINDGVTDKYKLMVVVESVHDAYRLISGMHIKPEELNLGGTKSTDNTKKISTAVNLTVSDEEELKKIEALGTRTFIQQVPNSAKSKFKSDLR